MSNNSVTHLLWVDLEGTGIDLSKDQILEVGAILTPADLSRNLAYYETLVRPTMSSLARVISSEPVWGMHSKSGLIADLSDPEKPKKTVAEVEKDLLDLLDRHGVQSLALAGSGVAHYDAPLIRRDMPELATRLPYWSLDTGTVRRALKILGGVDLRPAYHAETDKRHRALDDIEDHLAEARMFKDLFEGI